MKNCTYFDVRELGMSDMILGGPVAGLFIYPAWVGGPNTERQPFRFQKPAPQAKHVEFAVEMKKLGNPDGQQH